MSDVAPRGRLFGLLWPTWLVLGVFFLMPLAATLIISFARSDYEGGYQPIENVGRYVASGEFLHNYRESLDPLYLRIHGRSLWIATVTTALCLLVSYPIAYYIARVAPPRRRGLLLGLVVIPFWTCFLIRTYAWKFILGNQGLLNVCLMRLGIIDEPLQMLGTNFAVIVGLVYGELPFMILPLYASLEKLDGTLIEAASDLGAGPVATFTRVTVPLSMPGIVAGVVLVFIPAVGQFIVSDVLGGATTMLIGNQIQDQYVHVHNKPMGAAFAFELMAMVLALLAAYAIYARRRGGATL